MVAAIEYCKEHKIGKGKRVVVFLPDNIRNYMTKHLNNDWMYEKGYITEEQCAKSAVSDLIPNVDWGQDKTVADLNLQEAVFIDPTTTCGDLSQTMLSGGFAQYPVKDAEGKILGVVTKSDLLNKMVKKAVQPTDTIKDLIQKELRNVSSTVTLNELNRVLVRNQFVLVEKKYLVTTTDLLKTFTRFVAPESPVKAKEAAEVAANPSTPKTAASNGSDNSDDDFDKAAGNSMKIAAAASFVGIAATAAYVLMKQE